MAGDHVTPILESKDVPATIAWYRTAGFEVREAFPDERRRRCARWLARRGLRFLGGEETPWPGPPGLTGTIYLYPESVDAVYEEIREHVEPAWGPEDREWRARELGLQDPDGHVLTFTEPP